MSEEHPIMKGAEAFYSPGNHIGVLVIHGFAGTTYGVRPLFKAFAESGFTVLAPRLTGHGTDPKDMEKSSYKDWVNDVETALATLKETCSILFVAGLSMGGALTLYLAEQHPELAGIMTINAAVDMPDLKQQYEELKNGTKKFIPGMENDIKAEGVTGLSYNETPVKSIGDLINLLDIIRNDLPKITMPALVICSDVDHVVPPENSTYIYHAIASEEKTFLPLKNSFHAATIDNDKDYIIKNCIYFIEKQMERY